MRYDGVVGDALLELAKAKELATVLGGAWHANEEDLDSDCEEQPNNKDEDARAKVCRERNMVPKTGRIWSCIPEDYRERYAW